MGYYLLAQFDCNVHCYKEVNHDSLPPQSPQNLIKEFHRLPQDVQIVPPVSVVSFLEGLVLGGNEVALASYMFGFFAFGSDLRTGIGEVGRGGMESAAFLGPFAVIGFGLVVRVGPEISFGPLISVVVVMGMVVVEGLEVVYEGIGVFCCKL